MPIIDPRQRGKLVWNQLNDLASSNSTFADTGQPAPDTDPTGRQDASGQGTGVPAASGGDFWNQFLAKIKPYASAGGYNQIASNYDKLSGLVNAGIGAFGGEQGILKYLDYNPLKGVYTLLSYLNNTPYYDRSDDGSYKPFYVPGFDYDPNTPGVQGPSWLNTPYDPNAHVYRT